MMIVLIKATKIRNDNNMNNRTNNNNNIYSIII